MREYSDISKEVREKHACTHSKTELRNKQTKDGKPRIGNQCLKCGCIVGNIQPSKCLSSKTIQKLPLWDRALEQEYQKRIYAEIDSISEIEKAKDKAEWQKGYAEYLKTPKWKAIQNKVISRAKGICEGCGVNKATQAHHLTYDRAGDEMLFDLVAVCEECHNKIHQKDETHPEEIPDYDDENSSDSDESLPF